MRFKFVNSAFSMAVIVSLVILATGCGKQAGQGGAEEAATDVSNASSEGGDHSGWWCKEHGVPEEDCSICSSAAAARFKEKGDWCEQHNRAESQCFKCDPSRAEKFAKLHVAKFGTEPPKTTE